MSASEVLVDDQLVEALRKGLPLQGDRLSRALAAWRDDARLDESVREAMVLAASGAATTPAGALRCDGPENAPANRTDDLSPSFPEGSAAGPDDTDRSGGGTKPDAWEAARRAGETHRAAGRERARIAAEQCRAAINALLCERCDRSISAGDCTCRARRSNRKARVSNPITKGRKV